MDVYLLRHGIAEEAAPGAPDSERQLTSEGRTKLRAVLKHCARGYNSPALILTSPYRRALQTAEIAAKALNYAGPVVQTRTLVPESSPMAVWEEIRLHRKEPSILLVSHNPLLTYLTSFLLGTPELQIDFKKAGLLKLVIEGFSARPRGVLRWYVTPVLAGTED